MKQWCLYLAVDTEARGPKAIDPRHPKTQLTHISWANERGNDGSQPFKHGRCHESWKAIPQWESNSRQAKAIRDPRVIKLFWNAKYDLRTLKRAGVEIRGPIMDVMLLGRIVHTAERTGTYTLKDFTRKFLSKTYVEETRLKKWVAAQKRKKLPSAYGDAPLLVLNPYSVLDAVATFELFWVMREALKPALAKLLGREHKILATTMRMEDRGMLIDEELTLELLTECTKQMKEIRSKLCKAVGDPAFNPNSGPQLIKVFYTKPKRNPVRMTKSGKQATDKVAMLMMRDKHNDPLASLVLDWRKVSKARGTYLKNFIDERDAKGILRASFNQSGTRTGRYSSSDPINFQNLTRPSPGAAGQIRDCFVSRPGYRFFCIDYDQIELRLGAHFARVEGMLRDIHAGIDLHGSTARRMFSIDPTHPDWKEKRQISKTLNFAIFYGIGSQEFMDTLIRESEMYLTLYEAAEFRKIYKTIYPEIEVYFDTIAGEVAKTGGVTNPFGRFMEVSVRKSYVGVNYVVQSTAADLIKERMLICDEILRTAKSGMVAIVHDELIFEIHHTEKKLVPILRREMEEMERFSVPLTCSVSIARRWGQKTELNLKRAS